MKTIDEIIRSNRDFFESRTFGRVTLSGSTGNWRAGFIQVLLKEALYLTCLKQQW